MPGIEDSIVGQKPDGTYMPIQVDANGFLRTVLTKGEVTTAHNAISGTATSDEIVCTGFNALLVSIDLGATGTPNWSIAIQGSMTAGGNFAPWYEFQSGAAVAMTLGSITTDIGAVFRGIPDYVKIVATENSGTGTCTVLAQPINL